jgi:glycerol-3-phosphate dehydrogenase
MNDARLNLSIAKTAIYYGATVLNYMKVHELLKDDLGRIIGAILKDQLNGDEYRIYNQVTVNAGGPFSDQISRLASVGKENHTIASSGVHIVLPNYYAPAKMGLIDPKTKDGRVLFFLPWGGNTLAGTTDVPEEKVITDPVAKKEDIDFILEGISRYLAMPVRKSDVLAAWSGIRPLEKGEDYGTIETKQVVRSHSVKVCVETGMVSIIGGKWTTYRHMAEDTIDTVVKILGRNEVSKTRDIPLIGAHGYRPLGHLQLIQHFGLATDIAKHIYKSYGDRSLNVLMCASPTDKRWPILGRRLAEYYPFIEAEVRYAIRYEYAQKVSDVLARRTRISFLNVQAAKESIDRIVSIMKEEKKWDNKRAEQEKNEALEFLKTMGLDNVKVARGEWSKEQFQIIKDFFKQNPYKRHPLSELMKKLNIKTRESNEYIMNLQELIDYLDNLMITNNIAT